ncbi:MAG: ATP-binding cassette domain-containing protein [Candidatus Bipolaricaulis sp.]|nr:ATP-binding cassette domain-containing protein [Candidatus Bipolaricaulis sp.]
MRETAIEVSRVSKGFPGVQALRGVTFSVRKGEIHAVVGENGAGKSTLMKILAGAQAPDGGTVSLFGADVKEFAPEAARRAGVAIIYQEFNLIPHLSAASNVFLGREPHRLGWLRRREELRRAKAVLEELGMAASPRRPVGRLSVADQQLVEIAKALSEDASILIMDEPASALSIDERERLFAIVERLRAKGMSILYVSHHLDEVFRLADRITVLKDGELVVTKDAAATDRNEIITCMVGRKLDQVFPRRAERVGPTILAARHLEAAPRVADASFELHRGEILGLYGLVGAGRTELCQALFGTRRSRGTVELDGHSVRIRSPHAAIRRRIAFLTEDRKREGLVLGLSVRENLTLPSLRRRQRGSLIRTRDERTAVDRIIGLLGIRTPDAESLVVQLSGGNQQKVVIGKWLLTEPDILICDEPTRGIDVGSKAEIYAHLRRLADEGMAILMVSSELPEILGMSDRIVVMREGRTVGELEGSEATEEKVMAVALAERTEEACAPGEAAAECAEGVFRRAGRRLVALSTTTEFIVFAALATLFVAGVLTSPTFLGAYNLTSILRYAAALGIVAVGQAVAMQAGGVDLSVGSTITLAMMAAATIMNGSDAMILPAALAAVGVGLVIGAVNGLAVVGLRIAPFIATLGVMSLARGAVFLITHGPVGSIGRGFRAFSRGAVGPFPSAFFIVVGAFAIAILVMNATRYGRHVFAVGGSQEVARLAGVRVRSVVFSTFLVSGACAAVAALYLTSRTGSASPSVGPEFALDSIIAVLIGGIPFGGGRGNILGVLAGVLLLAVLGNLLSAWNLSSWYYQIARALVLLAAIALVKKEA